MARMDNGIRLPSGVSSHEEWLDLSDGAAVRVVELTPNLRERGDDPIIVFVPGVLSTMHGWLAVLGELLTRYPVLYLETREKVTSRVRRVRPGGFTVERLCDDLAEVLAARVGPTRPFCFMGSSLGSTVIVEYLGRGERRPATSILIAPNAEFRGPRWFFPLVRVLPLWLFVAFKPASRWYLTNVMLDPQEEPEQVARYGRCIDLADPAKLRASVVALQDYQGWESYGRIRDPVLILAGESDRFHSLDDTRRIASLIPGARLRILGSNRETHSVTAAQIALEEIGQVWHRS
ncbi:alpha/beta fold hydrolase [Gemmatimonadota bacterium]